MAYPSTVSAPAPPSPARKIKPSAAWYWIGAILIALGIAGAIAMIVVGAVSVSNTVDKFGRFVAQDGPSVDLQFERSGTYTVYYGWDSKVGGVREKTTEGLKNQMSMVLVGDDGQQHQVEASNTSA